MTKPPTLTHVNADGMPGMVDVSTKPVTARRALAVAEVVFPPDALAALRSAGWHTKKGAVFQTAIIAGTQAVKATSTLIPFCHPLPIDSVRFSHTETDDGIQITCEVQATYRTGVEMEALTGASIAALTVIDMCKALSHAIAIREVKLLEKSGGKREVRQP
jgi:cyclic pyranopterin phosphate synthase